MARYSRLIVAALIVTSACDLPTEAPRWEQTWVVPAEEVAVAVADLLPPGIGVTADGAAFTATTTSLDLSMMLAEMCEGCDVVDGLVAPKPGFTATLTGSVELPDDLVAAALAGGELGIELEHEFTFDPLRPSGAEGDPGYLVLSVSSNGTTLARDSVSGQDQAFPAGAILAATLPLEPGTIANALILEVTVYSPAGDPTLIRSSDRLMVRAPPAQVAIAEATIRAAELDVAPTRTTLNFDIDTTMLERIQRGALRFVVDNPWELTGSLVVRFELDDRVIERSLAIEPGRFTRRIELPGEDLQAILGEASVELVTSGQVSAIGGTLTVTPGQELALESEFELVVLVGGREEES